MTDKEGTETKKPGLLLVDDEKNILSSLRRLFQPEGYRIFLAEGGAAGLDILEKEEIDVIISDMRMPNMSGAEFLAAVAEKWPRTERILLTGYSDLSSTVAAVNEGHIFRYISKPWEDNDIKFTVEQALKKKHIEEERNRLLIVTHKQNQRLKEFNTNLESMVEARTQEIQQTADMLDLAYEEIKHSYTQSIPIFANLIEMREGTSAGHSRRVGEMAKGIAERMGLEEQKVQCIYFAGLLHDVGKLGLPDNLLNRPYARLSPKEKKQVDGHARAGQAALIALEALEDAGQMIRSHHERFDGKGFPDGLKGEEIPLGARIIAIVNEFDALQLGTMLEGVFTSEEALQFIDTHKGTRYDPDLVPVFMQWYLDNQHTYKGIQEVAVTHTDLVVGMKLSRDLMSKQGLLLLSRGHILDQRLIDRIAAFQRDEETVYTIYVESTPNHYEI